MLFREGELRSPQLGDWQKRGDTGEAWGPGRGEEGERNTSEYILTSPDNIFTAPNGSLSNQHRIAKLWESACCKVATLYNLLPNAIKHTS